MYTLPNSQYMDRHSKIVADLSIIILCPILSDSKITDVVMDYFHILWYFIKHDKIKENLKQKSGL